ncbi:MAG: hypothetical protein AAFX79_13645 [Planctomycetota bacterium]
MTISLELGYYPKRLDFTVGDVTVSTLDDLDESAMGVNECCLIEKDWIYAPRQRVRDFMSGELTTLPYSARIFGLPKTHRIDHANAGDIEHVRFLVWVLGFIKGMRLTDAEAGFLDATPIKPGTLHDMVWDRKSEEKALGIADAFGRRHAGNPKISKMIVGVIHSLFLSQTPSLLCFEKFVYLYTALDGCHHAHSITTNQNPRAGGHAARIAKLCSAFGCPVPAWADPQNKQVADLRNDTLHEGLFFDEPLGFRVFSGTSPTGSHQNILLEMRCLVCRFLCAMLGFNDQQYVTSPVNTRQMIEIQL